MIFTSQFVNHIYLLPIFFVQNHAISLNKITGKVKRRSGEKIIPTTLERLNLKTWMVEFAGLKLLKVCLQVVYVSSVLTGKNYLVPKTASKRNVFSAKFILYL